ncbi:MAG: DUF2851 family protein [Ktedonobacteraceae bacterium]|nr:DUF2851 family protein [Ktedonobacteraceae bacterium]
MNASAVYARTLYESSSPYENEVARHWWALPPGTRLPLSNGEAYYLLFAGRPGSSVGPDVHDAVLSTKRGRQKLVGDIEFHVHSSAWVVHQHHTNPRYNNVLLHVVLVYDDATPTRRQDGVVVPVCSLNDLSPTRLWPPLTHEHTRWPCHAVMQQLSDQQRCNLLRRAGLLRFEQKTHAFIEQLHTSEASERDTLCRYDRCLLPALAEGLGYGRNREFFRAAGLHLLDRDHPLPEPLGRSTAPPPLDAGRLRMLQTIAEEWQAAGMWQTLQRAMCSPTPLLALRCLFSDVGLARADILICNVVLPFAAAVAILEHDRALSVLAQQLYESHPGLVSNRITRSMCMQLQLKTMPRGSCQQQGLHYIHQQTCKEKQCELCIAGRSML